MSRELTAWLAAWVAETTGVADVRPDRPLHEYGLSSRDMVRLAAELADRVGVPLPPTLAYQHPTIAALAAAVETGAGPVPTARAGAAPAEPIAVVGIGCRLPGGVEGPADFWRLLDDGVDAVGPRPPGRWDAPEHVLAALPEHGGWLPDVAGFDAGFFGITPREAALMDPQQRIVLEVAWAAIEHAGIAPGSLRGSRTGVYMGVSSAEYGAITLADPAAAEAWASPGAAASVVANRLSYLLDLRGPSQVVDTACSSSLVAVHSAIAALRGGEADLAIAGGVNLMLTPGVTAAFHRAGALAADGRCKPFAAAADGIARGEGCGIVVLRRLTDARADGDRVLAVLRGSAVNSDGRSNGMLAPNPAAQAALLAEVYPDSGVDPGTVDYVEAHGTGTLLGDPIEAGALGAVLGAGRDPARPLLLGSVKSNFGHLEAAAGVVGLIKVVLAMTNGRLPASLHHTEPNPHIDFAELGLLVAAEGREWPRYSGLACAGVSAFGFGGTNAHVVVEEWPALPAGTAPDSGAREILAVSGPDADSVRARAAALADWLDAAAHPLADHPLTGRPLADVAAALAVRRDHLPARAAVVAVDRAEAAAGLRALGEVATVGVDLAGPVFVFSGFGSSWPGMGAALLAEEPAFADAVAGLDPVFRADAGFSLAEVLAADGDRDALPDLTVAAPALYGMQLALAGLWQAHGVHPAAVLGHSLGEVAAAVVAGALDPVQGLRVVTARSALLARLDGGAMAAVELSDAEFAALAPRFPGVAIAVHAAPGQCTVTGDRDAVAELAAHVEGMGRMAKLLRVAGAGHSRHVDPVLGELRAALDGLTPGPAELPCFSSVQEGPPAFDIDYWAANLRSPVRFRQAVESASAAGHRVFLEISPHPIAATAVEQTVGRAAVVATLRRGGDWPRAVADLHVAGDSAALRARYPDAPVLDLPGPVWRHERHWTAPRPRAADGHPLLGAHVEVPDDGRHLWQADLGARPTPWQADHVAFGVGVLPGAAFLEAALAAGRAVLGVGAVAVADLALPEFLAPDQDTVLSTSLTRDGSLRVAARGADAAWTTHATGRVLADDGAPATVPAAPGTLAPIDLYAAFSAIGQEYGPAFRGLADVRATPGYATARVALPDAAGGQAGYAAHPALTDACLQAIAAAALGLPGVRGRHVPTGFDLVRLLGDPSTGTRCVAEAALSGSAMVGAVHLLDDAGQVLLAATGVRVTAVADPDGARMLEPRWEPAPLPTTPGRANPDDVVLRLTGTGQELVARVARTAARLAEQTRPPRLWLVTSGGNGPEPGDPDLVCLRGLVRVLAFEHPELRATLLDVDDASGEAAVAAEIRAGRPDDEVAWRQGNRLRARLVPVAQPEREPDIGPGAYLVTGGLGELGGHIAAWLAERGATRIVLAGRTDRPAPAVPGVEVVLGDLAEPGVAERFVAHARRDGVPLRGVVHGAAVLADEAVTALTDDALERVWRPKALGAQRLHEAVDDPATWWLALTSVAGQIGSPGQAAYAAANAWVDALAARRAAAGLPSLSVAFGAWRGANADARANAALADLDPADGLAALGALLADGRTGVGVARLDGARTLALFPGLAERPFLAAVAGDRPDQGPAGWAGPEALRALPDPRGTVLERLTTGLAALIGTDPARVDPAEPLTRMGLDSLMAMRLRTAVQRDFGLVLPVPLLLRGASLHDVTDHLADELGLGGRVQRADIGPRDTAERWVARVWADALGAPVTDVRTAFSTLGGDPAALAVVRSALAARLGADVAVSGLDTVADTADRLREDLERPTSGLVHTLRAEGQRRPLFLFHPAGGPTTVYQPLVAELPPGYPVHGLERIDEVSTVEEKARRYAVLLRGIQPHGPYRLGGWSFGGILAYETAHVLTALGEAVDQVVLIDSILPVRGEAAESEDAALLAGRFARFAEHVERTYGVPLDLPADLAEQDEDAQIGWVMSRLGAIPGIGDAVLRHQYTSYVDARVAERYRPRPYPGRVALLRATDPHPLTTTLDPRYLRTDDALGWDAHCADLTVLRAPGDHLSMIDPPHAAVLARLLDRATEDTEAVGDPR